MSNWNARKKDEAKTILEVMMAEKFSKVMIVQHLYNIYIYIYREECLLTTVENCREQKTKNKS